MLGICLKSYSISTVSTFESELNISEKEIDNKVLEAIEELKR